MTTIQRTVEVSQTLRPLLQRSRARIISNDALPSKIFPEILRDEACTITFKAPGRYFFLLNAENQFLTLSFLKPSEKKAITMGKRCQDLNVDAFNVHRNILDDLKTGGPIILPTNLSILEVSGSLRVQDSFEQLCVFTEVYSQLAENGLRGEAALDFLSSQPQGFGSSTQSFVTILRQELQLIWDDIESTKRRVSNLEQRMALTDRQALELRALETDYLERRKAMQQRHQKELNDLSLVAPLAIS